jgi:hypothetical protein
MSKFVIEVDDDEETQQEIQLSKSTQDSNQLYEFPLKGELERPNRDKISQLFSLINSSKSQTELISKNCIQIFQTFNQIQPLLLSLCYFF